DWQDRVLLPRLSERLQTRQPGHAHIRNHQVKRFGPQQGQGAFARIGHDYFKSLPLEEGLEQTALAGIIIHNQDARRLRSAIAALVGHSAAQFWTAASAYCFYAVKKETNPGRRRSPRPSPGVESCGVGRVNALARLLILGPRDKGRGDRLTGLF